MADYFIRPALDFGRADTSNPRPLAVGAHTAIGGEIQHGLLLHAGGGDSIARAMPDAKDPDEPLFLPNVEYDPIESPAPAVKQVTRGKPKLLRFGDDRQRAGFWLRVSIAANRRTSH
jgi:hypothetical protein